MIVGTAGHIDHGKTSLVKALTGVDTDRLPEEKARGISIELGFAYTVLEDGQSLGFVDVPGHERFVHTMLAGATSIDFVVLVVAADDGVMAQTREHLSILGILGLSDGVVALTKCDLVDEARLAAVEAEIRVALAASSLRDADILPVSSVTGAGIAGLRTRLAEEAMSRPARPGRGQLRIAVDRAFSIAGAGTIAAGAITGGRITVGDIVVALPSGAECRVRSLHVNGRAATVATYGDRCALNLVGADLSRGDVARGDWLVAPDARMATARVDARVELLASEKRPLATWVPVFVHVGTSAAPARIIVLSSEKLLPGGNALVQLVLPKALPLRHGDRVVLRDIGAERTIGGGMVVDPQPPSRKRRTDGRLAMLAALEEIVAAEALSRLAEVEAGLVDVHAFAAGRGLTPAELVTALAEAGLVAVGCATEGQVPRFATSESRLDALAMSFETALGASHAREPALAAIPLQRVRLAMSPRIAPDECEDLAGHLVAAERVARLGGGVRLPNHKSALADADMRVWDKLRPHLLAKPRHPPTLREIGLAIKVEVQGLRRVAKQLARLGELVEIGADRYFARSAVIELAEVVAELGRTRALGVFTAADFRDAAGTGRNVGIAVLEYFDRVGITVRRGDERRPGKPAAEVLARRP
ncbi:MAG TPA: selenocysteine-specific translation elongation factor [Hyphomicrobiaceae bacterium]|nr:selenocysteine-specific translation elongation factor [Hyphomicrobiaceae bacterium]